MAKQIITIDGPAASGKSTVAKEIAEKIGAVFLDTGAMYRAATLAAVRKKCDLSDKEALEKILDETRFDFETADGKMTVFVDGVEVTEDIRLPEITDKVHHIASVPRLREKLVEMQRQFAAKYEKIVTEGRDQGTVVFPQACPKFFLTASSSARATRRADELKAKGFSTDTGQIKRQIDKRDNADKGRVAGPLVKAEDAVKIDTTDMTVRQVVAELMRYIKR